MSGNKDSNLGAGSSKDALPVPGDSDLDRAVARFLMQSGLCQDQGTLRMSGASGSDLPSAPPPKCPAVQASIPTITAAASALKVSRPASLPQEEPVPAPAADSSRRSQDTSGQQRANMTSSSEPRRANSRGSLLYPDVGSQLEADSASYTAISIRNFGSGKLKPIPRYAKPLTRDSFSGAPLSSAAARQPSTDGALVQSQKPRRLSSLVGNM